MLTSYKGYTFNNDGIGSCDIDTYGYLTNNTDNPVGGGSGYSNIVLNNSDVDYVIINNLTNKTQFFSALSNAQAGDIIYINDSVEMNLTYNTNIIIPSGVTIASGRGNNNSQGALLYNNYIAPSGDYQLFKSSGPNVRITGLRINGTDYKTSNSSYEFSTSRAIYSEYPIEIDNSEIMGWSHCAICLYKGAFGYVHNNYIHHNQRAGIGYGIVLAYASSSMIESNIFDWNRHSIAADGTPETSYTARYNLVLSNGTSHAFDMHGGKDRNDGTNIAGKTIDIYSNTFYKIRNGAAIQNTVAIRGIPTNHANIWSNYLYYNTTDSYTFRQSNAFGNMSIFNNCYNNSYKESFSAKTSHQSINITINKWNSNIELNESSLNSSNKVRYNIGSRQSNSNYSVKVYWDNGTKFQDFYVKSNVSGYINYNSTGYEYNRYTVIEPVTLTSKESYPIESIVITIVIGGVAYYFRKIRKVQK